MLDEIDDPNCHQWLCVRRLLMFHHPLEGADAAEWLDKGLPVKPGWNSRRSPLKDYDTFTFIDDRYRSGETRFNPPPTADIHNARAFSALRETEIWKIACRLAAIFNETAILDPLERSAFIGRDALKAACTAYTKTITNQIGQRGNEWFRWAPRAVLDAYMRFEVPGVVAAVCLGSVLDATIHFLCEAAGELKHVPVIRAAVSSHFADMVYRLLRNRRSCNVSGYYQLSYLAILYSLTVAVVADGLTKELDPMRQDALKRVLLNNEEKACCMLNPLFLALPARFSTVGILKYIVGYCHLSGETIEEAVAVHNLHASLAVAMCAEARAFSVVGRDAAAGESGNIHVVSDECLEDVQSRVHGRYVAESQRLKSVDLPEILKGEFNPIHERIDGLLTSRIDRKKVRKAVVSWEWPGNNVGMRTDGEPRFI